LSDDRTISLPEYRALNSYLNEINDKSPESGHNLVADFLSAAGLGAAPPQTKGGAMQEHILRQLDDLAKRITRLENRIFDAPADPPEKHSNPQKGGKARA
jgi:hypothetical protein